MTNILQATFESTDDGVVTKKCIIVLITYVAQLLFYNLVQAVKTKVYNSKIFILRWSKIFDHPHTNCWRDYKYLVCLRHSYNYAWDKQNFMGQV